MRRFPSVINLVLSFFVVTALPTSLSAAQIDFVENSVDHLGYVNIYGGIDEGDSIRFHQAALHLIQRGDTVFLVNICSKGGLVSEAMSIGDQIKTLHARTKTAFVTSAQGSRVVKCGLTSEDLTTTYVTQEYSGQNGDVNADCASACFLIWASGIAREGSRIGIHRPIFDPRMYIALEARSAETEFGEATAMFRRFLRERDVPDSIIDVLYATGSNRIHYLNTSELVLMRSAPWLEELILARCGNRPVNTNNYDVAIDTEVSSHTYRACVRSILREEQLSGAADYSQHHSTQTADVDKDDDPPRRSARSSVVGESPTSYWQFYGSQLYMTKSGTRRQFFFETPREGLGDLGISHGSLFFQGSFDRGSYDGLAIAYARGCSTLSYSVTGEVSSDGKMIILKGVRPTRDEHCQITGSRNVVITLDFSRFADLQ